MLGDLVGNRSSHRARIAHSYAERGGAWPAALSGRPVTGGDAMAEGLIAGTLVATETGWKAVETLQVGDRIVTFDSGMRPVKAVRRAVLHTAAGAAPRTVWPMAIPAGALGNRTAMTLLPGQSVLIESDAAEMLYGDPFSMVQAGMLEGHNGIARVQPEAETPIVMLEFDEDEVIYVNGMLLVHCAVHRPDSALAPDNALTPYQRLTDQQARLLMKTLHPAA